MISILYIKVNGFNFILFLELSRSVHRILFVLAELWIQLSTFKLSCCCRV